MKLNFNILVFVLAVALIAVANGCVSPPRSAYRPIHQFAEAGDAAAVAQDLATNSSDLDVPDDGGLTPLHLAAAHCRTNVVLLLLDEGAKVNARAKGGATPLHLAAQEGCVDVVTILLARGAKINARDDKGYTPLKRAELWHQDAAAQILRQHGGTE
jgi:ankyrin repeat protein